MPSESRYKDVFPAVVQQNIQRSIIEVVEMSSRDVKCPRCRFVITRAYADIQGHLNVKCQKCKWDGVINLAELFVLAVLALNIPIDADIKSHLSHHLL